MSLRWIIGGLSCLILLAPETVAGLQSRHSDPDVRVRYYSRKISGNPRHWPAQALLGAAYLDKARETNDPSFLDEARHSLRRSLDIQQNFMALKTMAALCNFAHRFEEALEWGRLAAEAFPADTSVTAILVEANLGLGRDLEAAELLPPEGGEPSDFYLAAAEGHWFTSQNRLNEAAGAFSRAASLAHAQGVEELALWAEVSAAGALLDSGRIDQAREHIEAASRIDPEDSYLRIHRAELVEALGRRAEALAIYEELLARKADPAISARAFRLARQLGREAPARRHFREAEKGYRRALAAGEVYTLEALARLYADAGVNLQEALDLARRNLQYKRDRAARETVMRLGEGATGSPEPS